MSIIISVWWRSANAGRIVKERPKDNEVRGTAGQVAHRFEVGRSAGTAQADGGQPKGRLEANGGLTAVAGGAEPSLELVCEGARLRNCAAP